MTSTERARLWRLANPERWKEHQERYRAKHKKPRKPAQDTKVLQKKYREFYQAEFSKYKITLGCSRCGYNKCAAALDFHHLNPNEKERKVTARMWKSGLGKYEMDKCILVCKNCHMEIHEQDTKIKENGDVY